MMRSSVDLPPPLGPSSAVSWPGRDAHGDVVEGDEVAEALADAGDLDAQRLAPPSAGGCETTTMQATDDEGQQERGGVGAALVEVEVLLLDHQGGGRVSPSTLPDTTLTAPNSPSDRARLSTTP